MDSPYVWEPVRRLESCPTSDGAAAMVLANEKVADAAKNPSRGCTATAIRSELGQFPGRDPVNPQGRAGLRGRRLRAGRHHRTRSTTWTCSSATSRSRGTSRCGSRTSASRTRATAGSSIEKGETNFGGTLPTNVSGGVLSSNPIGASGMLRFLEAALQVRGMAGEHQVDGAKTAVGHAYGGAAQFFAMWVVRDEKP